MTVTVPSFNPILLEGLSSDTKPLTYEAPGNPTQPVPPRSSFVETDTGKYFVFTGSTWASAGTPVSDLEFINYFLGE